MAYPVLDFGEKWETIQKSIEKLVRFVDDNGVNHEGNIALFSNTEKMSIYNAMYNLGARNVGCREELYRRYQDFFEEHINLEMNRTVETIHRTYSDPMGIGNSPLPVLPAMRDKSRELLLREVVKRWREYKFIVRWMSSFFMYLDQFFTRIGDDRRMRNTALLILHNQVYEELKGQIINTIFSMIDADRDGNSVDRALVKEVLEIVYDLQSETLSAAYKTDFELALLESSGAYYLIKTDNWYQNLPYPEYMSKVVECLNAENFRAMQYLHPSTVQKLLEDIDGNNLASKVPQLNSGAILLGTIF